MSLRRGHITMERFPTLQHTNELCLDGGFQNRHQSDVGGDAGTLSRSTDTTLHAGNYILSCPARPAERFGCQTLSISSQKQLRETRCVRRPSWPWITACLGLERRIGASNNNISCIAKPETGSGDQRFLSRKCSWHPEISQTRRGLSASFDRAIRRPANADCRHSDETGLGTDEGPGDA